MDRRIVYPLSVPQDVDVLWPQRHAMTALGYLMAALFGTAPVAAGFACSVSGLSVTIGAGTLTSYGAVDSNPFGSLATNSANIQKIGINETSTTYTITAPAVNTTSSSLIEAQYYEQDGTPVVLPYYDASNPTSAFSGPSNSGLPNNTVRTQGVNLQIISGTTATSGWTPLWIVYATTNSSSVTTLNIVQHPNAPFLPFTQPSLTPGFSRMTVLSSVGAGTWTVPAGVMIGKVRCWGPGGSGGNGSGYAGAGGGGGGYGETLMSVTPQQVISYVVGSSGTASNFGTIVSCGAGGNGGNGVSGSSTQGTGGAAATFGSGAYGSNLAIAGQSGGAGWSNGSVSIPGSGGAAFGGSAGAFGFYATAAGGAGFNVGGGGGAATGSNTGGVGGQGLIILEY